MGQETRSPLERAVNGGAEQLSDKQTRSALTESIDRMNKTEQTLTQHKDILLKTGTNMIHMGETLGSTFVASMAEGYFGRKRLQIGGVDLRAPVGLMLQGFGIYQNLEGKQTGQHAMALGNGVSAAWLSSVGREAGQALRERRSSQTPAQSSATPAGTPSLQGEEPMVRIPELNRELAYAYGGFAAPLGLLPPPTPPLQSMQGWQPWMSAPAPAPAQNQASPRWSAQGWQQPMTPQQEMQMPQTAGAVPGGWPGVIPPFQGANPPNGGVREIMPDGFNTMQPAPPYNPAAYGAGPYNTMPYNGYPPPGYGSIAPPPGAGSAPPGTPVMRFTPEAPAQQAPRMMFTPDAPTASANQEVSGRTRSNNEARGPETLAGGPLPGPGPRGVVARRLAENRFPRSSPSEESADE